LSDLIAPSLLDLALLPAAVARQAADSYRGLHSFEPFESFGFLQINVFGHAHAAAYREENN